jgi:hypothetical protein
MAERDRLIKDAGWFGKSRDWERIEFDVWTARAPGGRGVRLSMKPLPPLPDDPTAPTWIHVSKGTLRGVIERFLGRREIEVGSYYAREEFMRDGASGWVGASEWNEGSTSPAPVFAGNMLPSDAEKMGRELVDFLFWSDMGASGKVKEALALGKAPKQSKLAPLALKGTPPIAITIVPTTGEDFASSLLAIGADVDGTRHRLFKGKERANPDVDMPMRDGWYTAAESERGLAAMAALLEEAAAAGDAPCEARAPAWPPTWRVRFFDRFDDKSAHVAREFTVPVRALRCRAVARYDALGRNGDPVLRSTMETLSEVGFDHLAPDGNAPPPPPRLAPEDTRQALLALARGPVGQPRTAALNVSLADGRGVLVRLADLADRPERLREADAHVVAIDDASMRALLLAALSHPAIAPGIQRPATTYPRGAAHGEFRVLERHPGLMHDVPLLIAYLTPAEAEAVTRSMVRALESRDPKAAAALRGVGAFRGRTLARGI